MSPDQRGPLPHTHLREAQLPGPDDGVQRGLRVSAGSFPQSWHLLLQRHGRLLDPVRAPKLPRPAVLHEARRVPQVQWLGGHLRHHRVLPQNHRVLIWNLTWFCLILFTLHPFPHVFVATGNVNKIMWSGMFYLTMLKMDPAYQYATVLNN